MFVLKENKLEEPYISKQVADDTSGSLLIQVSIHHTLGRVKLGKYLHSFI